MQGTDARSTTLYRGQLLPKDELEWLKTQIGKNITMNGFLSASLSSSIALDFCGEGKQRPFYESVFFQIDLPPYGLDPAMPYCSIAHLSDFKGEDEYLFKFGTIFEVISIETLTEEICQSSIPIEWFVDKKSMNNVEINTFSEALTAAMNLTDSFSWPIDQYSFQSLHENVNDVNIYSIYSRLESGAIGTIPSIDNPKTRLLELFMKRDEAFERYQAMMVAQAREKSYDILDIQGRQLIDNTNSDDTKNLLQSVEIKGVGVDVDHTKEWIPVTPIFNPHLPSSL
ncbi:unnamed protein product [Adineta steineri]|uniref:Uncharacterized protein n=1 Tax=Adineta steineri TaxID=433720 RepID=A0A815JDW9_9BILA|nr:unnamed protein product [Adineta steineri]CAF3846703.1 unnamed protein product [Adineta steineri]